MTLEERVVNIEERNKKVTRDKAWENSWSRKGILMGFTYLAIGSYLNVIGVSDPWQNAVVPAVGFMLSTLTLPLFKEIWERYLYNHEAGK